MSLLSQSEDYKNINRTTIKKKSTPTQSPGKGTFFQPLGNPEDGREHRALHKPTSELCIAWLEPLLWRLPAFLWYQNSVWPLFRSMWQMESSCQREKNNKREKKKSTRGKKISEREKHKKRGSAVHSSVQNKHWMRKNTITHTFFPLTEHTLIKLFVSALVSTYTKWYFCFHLLCHLLLIFHFLYLMHHSNMRGQQYYYLKSFSHTLHYCDFQ